MPLIFYQIGHILVRIALTSSNKLRSLEVGKGDTKPGGSLVPLVSQKTRLLHFFPHGHIMVATTPEIPFTFQVGNKQTKDVRGSRDDNCLKKQSFPRISRSLLFPPQKIEFNWFVFLTEHNITPNKITILSLGKI